ncbi:MAG: 50S ribosomal protein L31e [Fervidicoccaceae archaeon]
MSEKKTLTVRLSRVYWGRRARRAARAVKYLETLLKRRLRAEEVKIDPILNAYIWSRGSEKPPRKVKLLVEIEEKREITTKSGEKLTVPLRVRAKLAER